MGIREWLRAYPAMAVAVTGMGKYQKIKAAASIVMLAALALLSLFDLLPGFNATSRDLLLKGGAARPDDIVILTIDDYSIEELGRFPWPRSVYAALINNLAEGGAAAIAMDILFTEESDEWEDEAFMDALANAGNVVLPVQADILVRQEMGGSMSQSSIIGDDGLMVAFGVYYPIPMFAAQAADFGHINALPDEWDGFVRRGMGTFRNAEDDELIYEWAEAVYKEYCLAAGRDITEPPSRTFRSRPYIHFAGPPGTITHYPIYAALDPDIIDPSEFEGKIILIGAYATGLDDDSFFTPTSGSQRMYGVEIHANELNNMLRGEYIIPAPVWLDTLLLLAICASAAVLFTLIKRSLVKLGVFAASAVVLIGVWLLLFRYGRMISVSYALLALVLIYLTDVVLSYMEEFAERHRVMNIFGRYLAPQVLDKVIQDGEKSLGLGGEERELTALFADIRGFTSLSEILEPPQVVEILNDYLTLVTEAIFKHGGTLDKYIGDAAMALYNVPYEQDDHVMRAVRSALHMQELGAALHHDLMERYGRDVRFGIGINTGPAVFGNIGSPSRMDYTAIGDTVNVASRLESNAVAGQILISETVYEKIKDYVEAVPLGGLKVKGRESQVQTYEVKGFL